LWQMEIFFLGLRVDLLTRRAFVPFDGVSWLRCGASCADVHMSYDGRPELSPLLISAAEGPLPKPAVVHDGAAHAQP
jgi:hypothetical protein